MCCQQNPVWGTLATFNLTAQSLNRKTVYWRKVLPTLISGSLPTNEELPFGYSPMETSMGGPFNCQILFDEFRTHVISWVNGVCVHLNRCELYFSIVRWLACLFVWMSSGDMISTDLDAKLRPLDYDVSLLHCIMLAVFCFQLIHAVLPSSIACSCFI